VSVTAAAGFLASGLAAGLKGNGRNDLALVLNTGPVHAAAGVFTRNRVKAAPVVWSQEVLRDSRLRAVIVNSGGANACTDRRASLTHIAQLRLLRVPFDRLRAQMD
jgi:glutamate N-acetyltransferase/amino-acid N-acetyltransferase